MKNDQRGQSGQEDQDVPVPEVPATGSLESFEPAISPAAVLDEFGRWLERWAIYARSCAAQYKHSPSAPSLPVKDAPSYWQAAATQGPPAHWLELFTGKQDETTITEDSEEQLEDSTEKLTDVIRSFQAQLADFLIPPNQEIVRSKNRLSKAQETRSTVVPKGMDEPDEATELATSPVPAKPESISRPGESFPSTPEQPLEPSLPVEAPLTPPQIGPARARVTRLRVQLPPASLPPSTIPLPSSPGATQITQSGDPNEMYPPHPLPADSPKVTHLRLSRSHQSVLADTEQQTFGAALPAQEDLRAGPTTRFTPTQERASSFPESSMESEPAAIFPQPEGISGGGYVYVAQPDDFNSPPMMTEDTAPEPAWPEPENISETLAIRWPPATNELHWPTLPDPLPTDDSDIRPYQDAIRRRRIDREQGGGSWNG